MDHEAVVLPYGRMNPIGKSSKFNKNVLGFP